MPKQDDLGRRKYRRLKAKFLVSYRAMLSRGIYSGYDYVFTKDISCGGLLIMAEQHFPLGTSVEMVIRLPLYPEQTIRAQGEVTGSEQAGKGKLLFKTHIKFIDFDDAAFHELAAFIAREAGTIVYEEESSE